MPDPGTESPVVSNGPGPIITQPPFFLARFLFDGDSYALHEFAKERIHVLGPAWGSEVLGLLSGNPRECDDIYKNQRTEARALADGELADQWADLVRDHGCEKNLILAQTAKVIELLGVPKTDLPCIALETRISSRQFATLRISPPWLDNDGFRRTLSAALKSGLAPKTVRDLVGIEPITTEEMTVRMQRHLDDMYTSLARGMRGIADPSAGKLGEEELQKEISNHPLVIDTSGQRVFAHGRQVTPTKLTYELLAALAAVAASQNAILSRDEANTALWGEADRGDSALDSVVRRLREQLRGRGKSPRRTPSIEIETVRGRGWRLKLAPDEVLVV